MKRINILVIVIIILGIFINGLLAVRAVKFAAIVPFERIMYGTVFLYKTGHRESKIQYRDEITSINGVKTDHAGIIKSIQQTPAGERYTVGVAKKDSEIQLEFIREGLNGNMLWVFFLLILCANICIVWGIIILILHSYRYIASIFVYLSFSVGFMYFLIIELYTFRTLLPLFFVFGLLLASYGFAIGFNISKKSYLRYVGPGIFILVLIVFSICQYFPRIIGSRFPSLLLCFILLGCVIPGIWSIMKNVVKLGNPLIIFRNILFTGNIIIGFIIPVFVFIVPPGREPGVSISVMLTVLPLFILYTGSRLMEGGMSEWREFPIRETIAIVNNLVIALVGALLIYGIITKVDSTVTRVMYFSLLLVLMIILFDLKFYLIGKLEGIGLRVKDFYAISLQNIAELVSSPADLNLKVRKIFKEVRELTGVSVLKFYIIDEQITLHTQLDDMVENRHSDADLVKYFGVDRGIVFRYTLLDSSPYEKVLKEMMIRENVFLLVPGFINNRTRGVLMVGEKADTFFFSTQELRYLKTVAFQLYQLMENDRLYNDYIIKRNYEKELDIASYIQFQLLPGKTPENRGLNISFYNRPYIKVTGDYFDFIEIDSYRTAIVIGDVSGHGLSASMILSMTSSIINAMLKEKKTIEKAVYEVNHFLNHRYKGVDLISLFIGVYNKKTRELVYVNAGHCAPVIVRKNSKTISVLEGRSKILGADPGANYFSSKTTLNKNDEIILYTDGLVETCSDSGEIQFTESSLMSIISRYREKDVETKLKHIIQQINSFSRGAIRDDITIIGIKAV